MDRLIQYLRRHGVRATLRRAGVALWRALYSGRMVVFYCDLPVLECPTGELPHLTVVKHFRSVDDLDSTDLNVITTAWNPKLAIRNIEERFGLGAMLWLIKVGNEVAGYG